MGPNETKEITEPSLCYISSAKSWKGLYTTEIMYKVITDHGVISPSQLGFRKGYSSSTCLIDFLKNIYDKIDKGGAVGMLFLDLKKAFVTVRHSILVSKLSEICFSHDVLDWVESYLCGRSQITVVNNHRLSPGFECGVPQGSILGPLFFILYVNNLPDVLTESSVYLYVDDTAIAVGSTLNAAIMLT